MSDPDANVAVGTGRGSSWRTILSFVLGGVALAFLLRAETFAIAPGFDPDEGVSMLQGRALARGTLPYVAYFDNRQPLLYANFAVAELLLGERAVACRIWANLNFGLAASFLGLIVRRLIAGRASAWGAMALLLAVSMAAVPVALSEAFVLPWTTLAVLLALHAADARSTGRRFAFVVAAGLALGVAAEVKLLALVEGVALLAAFLVARRDDERLRPARAIGLLAALGVAVLAPTLLLAAIYHAAGHLDAFVYASFTYNRLYSATTHFEFVALAKFLVKFAIAAVPLVVPVAIAFFAARRGSGRAAIWVAVPWLIAAFAGACATKRFYDHYTALLLPSLCLIAAVGIDALRTLPRRRLLAATIVVLGAASFVGTILVRGPARATLASRGGAVTAAIASHVRPGDVVFLGNHDPSLYYVTRTEPATPWVFPFWIGDDRWLRVSKLHARAELDRIVASRPRVISYTHRPGKGWDQATIDFFDAKMRASPDWARIDPTGEPFEVFVPRDATTPP